MSSLDWSLGYDIDMLKQLSSVIKKEYKQYVYGAFGMPKERDIATALSENSVVKTKENDSLLIYSYYGKRGGRINDFTGETIKIKEGTHFIKHLAGIQKEKLLNYFIEKVDGKPLLIEIFDENPEMIELMNKYNFKWIATKIAASSDIKGIWAKNVDMKYSLAQGEDIFLKKISNQFLSDEQMNSIKEELISYSSWANHYSSYNKRQSWSAFALRGFDDDHNFIIKPAEMSQKWKKENESMMKRKSKWLEVSGKFPQTVKIVNEMFCGATPDRVRFMKLTKGKGELSRHADITDREAGIQPGKIVRLHIPIWTNDKVIFNSWSHKGERKEANMKAGELWYLDVRKPHTAVNGGEEDRIHLVMDFYTNEELTRKIIEA